jgi:hypothetical protein
MHVRRGDAGMVGEFRRYAAVQEYIDAANITRGETIFLLTDDESTIEEVRNVHANQYNWIYVDRPRATNVKGGFNSHFPSGDPAFEMLVLDTELTVASRCDKVVRGCSSFMENMLLSMNLDNKQYVEYYIDTVDWDEESKNFSSDAERAETLLQEVDMRNQMFQQN